MAARIQDAFGVEARLIGGGSGIFDVHVDGTRVYCKHDTGEFPDEAALIATLRQSRG